MGPDMVSGVYLVLARGMVNLVWNVALAAVPFGLSVVSINLGKHIDKSAQDRNKRIGTLPVMIGEKAARYLEQRRDCPHLFSYALLDLFPPLLYSDHVDRSF